MSIFGLSGRTAVITGGNGGIGLGHAIIATLALVFRRVEMIPTEL